MFHNVPELGVPHGIELSEVLTAFSRLRRENDLLVAAIARDHGLHAPDFRAMAFVSRTSDSTPRSLAEFLALSLSATTAVIDRLAAAGYVLRAPNPDDGRSFRLEVTPAGAEAVSEAAAIYVAAFDVAVPADHRDEVAATFVRIADALADAAVTRKAPLSAGAASR